MSVFSLLPSDKEEMLGFLSPVTIVSLNKIAFDTMETESQNVILFDAAHFVSKDNLKCAVLINVGYLKSSRLL